MAINFFHGDCMEFMRDKPDGYYDLAVVDPPYGGGGYEFSNGENRFGGWFKRYNLEKPKNMQDGRLVEREIPNPARGGL